MINTSSSFLTWNATNLTINRLEITVVSRKYTPPFFLTYSVYIHPQKYKYETKYSKESRYRNNKQSTQQCKVHEIRVTDETVNQAAVPLLISHQWRPRVNLRHDHRMSENP